jgi:hypothetical protein
VAMAWGANEKTAAPKKSDLMSLDMMVSSD